jgi:hypothetical protein
MPLSRLRALGSEFAPEPEIPLFNLFPFSLPRKLGSHTRSIPTTRPHETNSGGLMSTTRCSHRTGVAASLHETIGAIEPPVGLTMCREGQFHPPGGGKPAGVVSPPCLAANAERRLSWPSCARRRANAPASPSCVPKLQPATANRDALAQVGISCSATPLFSRLPRRALRGHSSTHTNSGRSQDRILLGRHLSLTHTVRCMLHM